MNQSNQKPSISLPHESPQIYIMKLPYLEKRIHSLVNQLKTGLNYIHPSDFCQRIELAKQSDQIDQQWVENYKDIVASKIQGRINTPLMRLSEDLRHEFGGQTMFWLDLVCSFAQNQKYQENLRIWQVIDTYKQYLHLHIGEYEKNRRFRKLAKNDIQISKKLITLINELKMAKQNQSGLIMNVEEILSKIGANFKLYEESNKKVVQFLKNTEGKQKSLQFFQTNLPIFRQNKLLISEVSNSRTKRASKDGYREKQKQQNQFKQRMITDFSVQMIENKNSQLLKKIVGKDKQPKNPSKSTVLDQIFSNLSYPTTPNIEDLRQFHIQPHPILKRSQPLITNICISYSFLQYVNFPLPTEKCPFHQFTDPFEQNPEIQYCNNDYEEYQQCKAQEISDGEIEDSEEEDSTLDDREKEEFYNQEDAYGMDFEDREVMAKAFRLGKVFMGNPWVFNAKWEQTFLIEQRDMLGYQEEKCIEMDTSGHDSNQGDSQAQAKLTPQMMERMVAQFFNETVVLGLSPVPMPVAATNPKKEDDLTQDETQTLKRIFNGRTYKEALDIIHSSEAYKLKFTNSRIRAFLATKTKKFWKVIDGKRSRIYKFENEQQQQGDSNSRMQTNHVPGVYGKEDCEEGFNDDEETGYNEPEQQKQQKMHQLNFQKQEGSYSQQFSNYRPKMQIESQQSKSQSLSNFNQSNSVTVTAQYSQKSKKDTLREFKSSQTDTNSINSLSRLRPRSSKPNYNINDLLKFPKKSQQKKDIEI